jgi:TolA-binding protein
MFCKVLLIVACAAGAAVLGSCANAMKPGENVVPPDISLEPTTHPFVSTDATQEAAIEMILDGKYADAGRILEQLAAGYESVKDARRAAEAMFWLGYCKEKSGDRGEAARCYRRVMEHYPQTGAAGHAQDRLDGLGPQP